MYLMKKSISTVILWVLMLPIVIHAQETRTDKYNEKFPPDSIQSWTRDIMKVVSESHPGMYRYTPKSELDSLTNAMLQTVNDSLSTLKYYRKLKPLFAKIGCLHTSITLSENFKQYYQKTLTFIPIEIFIDDNRQVFLTKNYDKSNDIPLKSEIISINNQPISKILNILYDAIPSDGYNQTLKTLMLNHRFPFWYQTMLGVTDSFSITTKIKEQHSVYHLKGVAKETFPTFESIEHANEKQLTFKIQDSIGFLTIHSFRKTIIKKNGQNYSKFLTQAFKTLQQQKIENLVIDLRNNTGGTDGNAVLLASHLFKQPFRYWKQPVEITEKLAKDFKTWYTIFFKMPKKVDSTFQWKGMHWWLSKEFNYYKVQKPFKNNYNGTVYVITNGACMSSCADVVAILSYNHKVVVIGEETGGGYQGNTSGMMPTEEIRPNLKMTIPLQKYINAVDPNVNFGRGTIPDHRVTPTLKDWMENNDVPLKYVQKLIKSRSK